VLSPVYTIQPVVKPVVQPGLTTVLNEQWLFVQHGCQAGCQTGLTTSVTIGWMFVYTMQLVVKPVINRYDNRLYRVNWVLESDEWSKLVLDTSLVYSMLCFEWVWVVVSISEKID